MYKLYSLWLPYFRPGDDLSNALDEAEGDSSEAFQKHSSKLKEAVDMLDKLATYSKTGLIYIDNTDSYYIELNIEEALGKTLVQDGLVEEVDDRENDNYEEDNYKEEEEFDYDPKENPFED